MSYKIWKRINKKKLKQIKLNNCIHVAEMISIAHPFKQPNFSLFIVKNVQKQTNRFLPKFSSVLPTYQISNMSTFQHTSDPYIKFQVSKKISRYQEFILRWTHRRTNRPIGTKNFEIQRGPLLDSTYVQIETFGFCRSISRLTKITLTRI